MAINGGPIQRGVTAPRGFFGQTIRIDPKRHMVVAISSAWPKATDPKLAAERTAFIGRLFAAGD
jgi:CubicO group peptidase (beta-lactamase class C family)